MTYKVWLEELNKIRKDKKDTKEHHTSHKSLLNKERKHLQYYHDNQQRFLDEQLDKGRD